GPRPADRRFGDAAPDRLPARALPLPELADRARGAGGALRAGAPAPIAVEGRDPWSPRDRRPRRARRRSGRHVLQRQAAAPWPWRRTPGPARSGLSGRADVRPGP